MCIGSVIAGVVLSVLGLGWYKEIIGDKIIINDFNSLTPQEYSIQDITSITHYTHKLNSKGEVEAEPHYKISFSDGRVWDTSDNFHEASQEKYTAVVQHFTSKSNLKVRYQDVDTAN
ncbi:hypothetical protein POKO110462_04190 [Pontibacter korlensis]|uniref:Uncharacterized protein n=2 Tax=Pontibacter korlensis TaxID=400092 RepID=A0A0E3UX36_9BACT|nr:hypothetical protein PKOR_09070 [Pontibacter korlensis]